MTFVDTDVALSVSVFGKATLEDEEAFAALPRDMKGLRSGDETGLDIEASSNMGGGGGKRSSSVSLKARAPSRGRS